MPTKHLPKERYCINVPFWEWVRKSSAYIGVTLIQTGTIYHWYKIIRGNFTTELGRHFRNVGWG